MLTPVSRHAASPRLTPDGLTIVYFCNSLSTSNGYLFPGPQDQSRRLMKLNYTEAVKQAKENSNYGMTGIDIGQLIGK